MSTIRDARIQRALGYAWGRQDAVPGHVTRGATRTMAGSMAFAQSYADLLGSGDSGDSGYVPDLREAYATWQAAGSASSPATSRMSS